ncbi:ribonuclease J [Patescibacteria group bacterium]|nr:ribonuclease J [Patescibacteria group bacterium]
MNIKKQFTRRTIQTNKRPARPPHQTLPERERRLIAKLKTHKTMQKKKTTDHKNLKIIAVGGFEKIGKNCIGVEYDQDIILIDLGFAFPSRDMLGIDYVLPDISYFVKNKKKIRGIIISHGHLDHTGGIPYLIPQLGSVPIFTARLTSEMIKKRLEEFPNITANIKTIDPLKDKLRLGNFNIEFFRVNHSIPDAISIVVHSPEGTIVYTGDFKFDFTPATDKRANFQKIAEIGKKEVLLMLSESTNAHKQGFTISEKEIGESLDIAFTKCPGRIIIGTFSSLLSRIQQIINSAKKHGRKVSFAGYSMLQNFEIASRLKYYDLPRNILIAPHEIKNFPDDKIVVIAAGSQGQENSAIGRMSTGNHRFIKLKKGDTVILSSRPIPGNEKSVFNLIDNLIRQGANIIHDENMDVHTSGHGSAGDLKLMMTLINPKYLIPNHGSLYARYSHAKLGQDIGIPEQNTILLDNGQIAEFSNNQLISTKKKIPSGQVFVDGLGIGDIGNVVIRDRQHLAGDGIIVIIAQIKTDNTPAEDKDIDIISRGFVYMKEADPLINKIRQNIVEIINLKAENTQVDLNQIRNDLRDKIGEFVFQQTERRPMIIPVTIEV